MRKGKSHIHNLSNYFVESEDVGVDFSEVLKQVSDSVVGVEVDVQQDSVRRLVLSPPYVRLRDDVRYRELITEDYDMYEGYLSRPFFFPLYGDLEGQLINDLEELKLTKNERVCVQWLFRRADNWKDKAIDMYESYLNGNDAPVPFRLVRGFQDRTLRMLGKIMPFEQNQYIEAAEAKILDVGYQFQLRIAIRSDRGVDIKQQVVQLLQKYDAHNSIKLFKHKSKRFPSLYEGCILTVDTSDQIISGRELHSIVGGDTPVQRPVEPAASSQLVSASDIVRLLPLHHREEIQADTGRVTDLAGALKRVGLIKSARLHNESIVSGIRLTVIQTDIPKDKNLSHLTKKSKDIQAALGVPSLGIEQGDAPDTVKFVIPNDEPAMISLRELAELEEFQRYAKDNPLAFIVGVDEVNNPIFLSLSKLVHLLVAGTPGSGKSVFINSLITTLLLNYTPEHLRFVMIDPKQVELHQYNQFPHVDSVITDMEKAAEVLNQLVKEMERRYTLFAENGTKNITLYNQKIEKPIPYVVCVIDEYADLKDTTPEVEDDIARLGQKARAAGIHLVIVTQRPSVNILSGRIKATIPNAISFNLTNNTNYKTVFGQGIPYSLLGKGDGVMKIEGYPKEYQRFQSTIISPDESQEEKVYRSLADFYKGVQPAESEMLDDLIVEEAETLEELRHNVARAKGGEIKEVPLGESASLEQDSYSGEEDDLYKLRQLIADTKETRVEPLRKQLGVQTKKMKDLMSALVEEGWLEKSKDRSKGYQLIASESVLSEWKTTG
jgi:DNA segregation ATPase FtsK/SpoIIIE, S-DNA-T family